MRLFLYADRRVFVSNFFREEVGEGWGGLVATKSEIHATWSARDQTNNHLTVRRLAPSPANQQLQLDDNYQWIFTSYGVSLKFSPAFYGQMVESVWINGG